MSAAHRKKPPSPSHLVLSFIPAFAFARPRETNASSDLGETPMMPSGKRAGKRRAGDLGMADSIWSEPPPARSSRVAPTPTPIDTMATYNAYLNATPTSADSNTTRLIPANTPYTPPPDTEVFTADEMRLLDKATEEAATRAKIREVAERRMSQAAARVAYPQLYVDAPPPTKTWPWGGVVGSEAVKQTQTAILGALAEGSRTGAVQTNSNLPSPGDTGNSAIRAAAEVEAAATAPVDEPTPMDITPASSKTTPRTAAYPDHLQRSNGQRGPIEPKRANIPWANNLADLVEKVVPTLDGINSSDDAALCMRQVAGLLYRDSFMLEGSSVRGQMMVDASPAAVHVNACLKLAFDAHHPNHGQQYTERILDIEALAAKLEERASQKTTKVKLGQSAPAPAAPVKMPAGPAPTANMTLINDLMPSLLEVFPGLVADWVEMVAGMREVAVMLERDAEIFEGSRKVTDSVPSPTPAAQQVHSILHSTFTEPDVSDAQKMCDLRTMAQTLVDHAQTLVKHAEALNRN